MRVIWDGCLQKKGLCEFLMYESAKRDMLDIRSDITVYVSDLIDDPENYALTRWEDHWVRPREFRVLLNPMIDDDVDLLSTTVLHEMVHVKQLLRGEYRDRFDRDGTHRVFWKGKEVFPDRMVYEEMPWEVEAVTFEDHVKQFRGI